MVQDVNKQMRKYGVPAPSEGELSPAARISNLKETAGFLEQLRRKRIQIKPGVTRVDEENRRVTLSNGEDIEVDAIVCCTGYRTNMDYLEPGVRNAIIQMIQFDNADGSKREIVSCLTFSSRSRDRLGIGMAATVQGHYVSRRSFALCIGNDHLSRQRDLHRRNASALGDFHVEVSKVYLGGEG